MAHRVYAIRQTINIGNQFTGVLPTTTPVDVDGVRTYPADDQGGLFDLGDNTTPREIISIEAYFGGSPMTLWSLSILDDDGDMVITNGTNDNSVFWLPSRPAIILPGQEVGVSTTGSSKKMHCTLFFSHAPIGEE